nr:transcription initiation factor IID SU beta [Cryptomonas curvata]
MRIVKKKNYKAIYDNMKTPIHVLNNNENSEYSKIQLFTKTQMIRYGYYRRSDLKKDKIKKIICNFNPFLKNINSSDPLIITIKGLMKLFIGEIIEISKQIMFEKKDNVQWLDNAIQPKHIFESINRQFLNFL